MKLGATAYRAGTMMLLLNGIAAGVAAVVLAVAPSAIPNFAGIGVRPDQYFLCYLLAAAEAAIAGLCGFGFQGHQQRSMAMKVLVLLHMITIGLGLVTLDRHVNAVIAWNLLARLVIVLLLGVSLRWGSVKSRDEGR